MTKDGHKHLNRMKADIARWEAEAAGLAARLAAPGLSLDEFIRTARKRDRLMADIFLARKKCNNLLNGKSILGDGGGYRPELCPQ